MLARALAKLALRAADAARARVALAGATRVGAGVRVLGWPIVISEGHLVVERGVVFVARPSPVEILVARGASVFIGAGSVLESGATLRARHRLVIGRNVRVGVGCIIDDDGPDVGGVEIGDDAWLDDGALVVSGARVATRARVTRGTTPGSGDATSAAPVPDARGAVPLGEGDDRVRHVIAHVVPSALEISSDV